MTARGWALLAGSVVAAAAGWLLGWAPLVGLGAAGAVVVVAVAIVWGPRPTGEMRVEPAPDLVPRLSEASVPVVVEWATTPRRDWASCATADPAQPRQWVPPEGGRLPWPIDTRARGRFDVGPTDLRYGDPFGLAGCLVTAAAPSSTTITPRLVPVPHVRRRSSEADALEGVRVGHENFHTLREYVFGDEPRKIHWRSSARAQQLLVRVNVDAAEQQTVVVLDVDPEAYRRPGSLSGVVDDAVFEDAVDTAHSLALAASGPGQSSHVATTRLGDRSVTVDAHHRSTGAILLAHVTPAVGETTSGADVTVLLKRAAVRDVVVVTGRPQPGLQVAITGWQRLAPQVRLVAVVADTP